MLSPNDVVRLKEPLQIEAGTKGRVCGVNPDRSGKPILVAIWVRLDVYDIEPVNKEKE